MKRSAHGRTWVARTRLGLTYSSELDPTLDGKAKFKDLGPLTESIFDRAMLLNSRVDVESRLPQSFTFGAYHDFENGHTVTLDAAWIDFSRFKLAEIYVDGEQIGENEQEYDSTMAFAASYSWPIAERWRMGVGGFLVDDPVGKENRSMTFRLDDIWSLGVGLKWQWDERRVINASVNYLSVGDAPVELPFLGGFGQLTGDFTSRDTYYFRLSLSISPGKKP